MRAHDINVGQDYLIAVRISRVKAIRVSARHRARGFPGCTVMQRVKVVDKTPDGIVVEATRQVAVNVDDIPREQLTRAFVERRIRYEPRPHRWTVRARDIKREAL